MKNNAITLLCSVSLLFGCIEFAGAQTLKWNASGNRLNAKLNPKSDVGFLEFREDASISSATFFIEYKDVFGLTNDDAMNKISSQIDRYGSKHHKYVYYHKIIKVEVAEYILDEKDGSVFSANGFIPENLSLDSKPAITSANAINYAVKEVKAIRYKWQDDGSLYPEPELLIASSPTDNLYKLAYKVDV